MVRSSPRSVPPVDQCPTEIFRPCRALSRRLAALSCTAIIAEPEKPGKSAFFGPHPAMSKFNRINRLVWLRGQSRANPSPMGNSLFYGKIQGISRFCGRSTLIREADMPGIPRVSRANSLSGGAGNFRTGTGKNLPPSGNFGCRSGKPSDRRRTPTSGAIVAPSLQRAGAPISD
jgi:hypothetical protein